MTERNNHPERAGAGVGDRAEPAGTNASQGAPRPDTDLSAGRGGSQGSGSSIPDPDFGIDPRLTNPVYGNTDRGSGDVIAQASAHRMALEGNDQSAAHGASDTGGMARGGDTTSTADTFSNTRHGLGESGVRGHMDTGVNAPGAAGRETAPRDGAVDPNDESTLREGMQHADGPRA